MLCTIIGTFFAGKECCVREEVALSVKLFSSQFLKSNKLILSFAFLGHNSCSLGSYSTLAALYKAVIDESMNNLVVLLNRVRIID